MAPTYKLTYYPVRALAEPIRFLLSYGGVDFEDFRFERENWPKIKPSMPFGQVPVLEIDGKKAHQSIAICRYLGKKFNLVGSNECEDLEIDMIVDTINDFRGQLSMIHYEDDVAVKEKKKVVIFGETVPFYLSQFEEIAKKNDGHFALGKLTWADMYFVGLLGYLNSMAGKNLIADCSNLQKLESNVKSLPAIKAWIEKRPRSQL